jgi:phosphoribosylformimino-5-aminoimidazole carboxamide ribotide isomerase
MKWHEQGATRLHLVDLDGAKAGRPMNTPVIRRIVESVPVPCQLGGGLRDEEALFEVLDDIGVQRAIIGTQALKRPAWFADMAARYRGRLVLGIDARNGMVATEGWLEASQASALDLAKQYAALPLAAIIYTNIANDGMMQGVDPATLDDLVALSELGLPVIASGGVTTLADVEELARRHAEHAHLAGAIIGRALYEGTIPLPEAVAITQRA